MCLERRRKRLVIEEALQDVDPTVDHDSLEPAIDPDPEGTAAWVELQEERELERARGERQLALAS